MSASVPVASLLGARGAGADLEFDLLAGAAGLERGITLPYIQKTVGSSRVDLQACKLEYSIVSPK